MEPWKWRVGRSQLRSRAEFEDALFSQCRDDSVGQLRGYCISLALTNRARQPFFLSPSTPTWISRWQLGQTAATASGWSGPPSERRWRWCTSKYGPFLPWKGAGWRLSAFAYPRACSTKGVVVGFAPLRSNTAFIVRRHPHSCWLSCTSTSSVCSPRRTRSVTRCPA